MRRNIKITTLDDQPSRCLMTIYGSSLISSLHTLTFVASYYTSWGVYLHVHGCRRSWSGLERLSIQLDYISFSLVSVVGI
jgi:hypothetical protein